MGPPSDRRTSTSTPPESLQGHRLQGSTGRTNVTTDGQRTGGTAMRSKLRIMILTGGVGAVLVLVLLLLASGLGSWTLAIIGSLLGVLLIIIGCVVLLKFVDRFSGELDRSSTRARRLEARTEELESLQGRDRIHLNSARKDIRALRSRVPAGFLDPVEANIKELRVTARSAMRNSFESGIQLGRAPESLLSPGQASRLFTDYLSRDELLQLRPLIENFDLLEKQSLTTLRRLYRYYRSTGYWELSS